MTSYEIGERAGRIAKLWTPGVIDDYARFHWLALETGDVDPVYPVLRKLEMGVSDLVWLSFLHVAYYDLGSALRAFARLSWRPTEEVPNAVLHYPCGTERRAHRDPSQLLRHLESLRALADHFQGLHRFVTSATSYGDLFGRVISIWGNGRWAAYKTCELLAYALDRPEWEPTDMGHAHSTGPRKGLALIYGGRLPEGNGPAAIHTLNTLSGWLVNELGRRDLVASQATAETTLCDFHSLAGGRYYVGHDIDQMGMQIRRGLETERLHYEEGQSAALRFLLDANQRASATFAHWGNDIDKGRRQVYKLTGEILDPR